MANGIAKPILQGLDAVAGAAYPGTKLRAHGLAGMVITNTQPGDIQYNSAPGHKQQVDIKYKQPFTSAQTETSLACDDVLIPAYNEATVAVNNVRRLSFHIEDEVIAAYTADTSAAAQFPGSVPSSSATAEVIGTIYHAAEGLLRAINLDLWSLVTFGTNVVTASNSATTINFSSDTSVQKFDQGFPRLLSDYQKNGLTDRAQVVGEGNFLNVAMAQAMRGGVDQFGYDYRMALGMVDFWRDQDVLTGLGNANHIAVFEPGSIKFVEYNRYTGSKAGTFGADQFFQISLPMVDPMTNVATMVKFDVQTRYNPCTTTMTNSYTNGSITVEKGWQVILSKTFGLFQIPSDAFRHEDPRRSVNGALRYNVTVNCDTCA